MNRKQEIKNVIAADLNLLEKVKEGFQNGKLSPDDAAHDILDTVFLIEHNTKILDAHIERKNKTNKDEAFE